MFACLRTMASALRGAACVFAVGLGACAAAAAPVTVTDAAGRSVTIADASRIVSIGGAVTEILYALGRSERIVAVDTTSIYPPQALATHPNVGYQRQVSAEGVLGMRPSLVLAIEGTGPKETVAVLESAAVPLVLVPDHFTGQGVVEKIRLIAQATGARKQGECLAAAVTSQLDQLARLRDQVAAPARVLFVLSMAGDRLLVAGNGTAADGIIRLAGGVNAITGYDGYKAVNDEAIVAAKPDAILVMSRGRQVLTADTVFAHPAFKMTPAAAQRRLIAFDGLYLLGFGPRTPAAAGDLARALHPTLAQAGAGPSATSGVSECGT